MNRKIYGYVLALAIGSALLSESAHCVESAENAAGTVRVVVNCFEDVYSFVPPNNGSGPLWSFGCTPIARVGGSVFVSQMETGIDVPPLCNTRWRLLERQDPGWRVFAEASGFRQREPTLLASTSNDTLFLYVNDSNQPPGTKYGPCVPHLLRFSTADPVPASGTPIMPKWNTETFFTDHSYRGYAADRELDELLMLNIDAKTGIQHWCLLNAAGNTLANGQVEFPIRSCYPQVAIKNRAACVLAIGDIVEPVAEWRAYKLEQTGGEWDYVFRILYFTSSPDLTRQGFSPPIEIANADATCGHIRNQDLWVSPEGEAYVLYTEREVQSGLMRDRFFPDKSIEDALYMAVVREETVTQRLTLIGRDVAPGSAAFHETPDGRLFVLAHVGMPESRNVLIQVHPWPGETVMIPVPFPKPFWGFLTAHVRAGNEPLWTIDLVGNAASGKTITYAEATIAP